MKASLSLLLALAGVISISHGHEEGEGGRGSGEGRGPGGMMSRLPIMKALDKDQNGELSAEEIAGASAALVSLDKNGDGKLTTEEIRPVMQPRGETPAQTAHRTFEAFDKNTDGKLTADELPERMKTMIERADADKNGSVTEEELSKMIEKETPPAAPAGERAPAPREGESKEAKAPAKTGV